VAGYANKIANISPSIFREYDIRGQAISVSPRDELTLTPEVARLIGQALGSRLPEKSKALVTGDNRLSTPALRDSLALGLSQAGVDAFVGTQEMSTGGASWLALADDYALVVQVTGSHTPPEYNGFKITVRQKNGKASADADAVPTALYSRGLAALYEEIVAGRLRRSAALGTVTKVNGLVERYQKALVQAAKSLLPTGAFQYPKRVVLDAGNGLGGVLKEVLESLGVEVEGLFLESDGRFPNHPADPLLTRIDVPYRESGVRYTCERVSELNRRDSEGPRWFGIVTDGDGDRAGMVDELARPVRPETLGMIFYERYLQQNIAALELLESSNVELPMALDVRGTATFSELLQRFPAVKGKFIPAGYPVHRSFARTQIQRLLSLENQMKQSGKKWELLEGLVNNYLSAEVSGHYFFNIAPAPPEILVDDGLVSALKLLHIIDTAERFELQPHGTNPLAKLVERIPAKHTSEEIRLQCPDDRKFEVVEVVRRQAKKRFSDALPPILPIDEIQGVKTQSPESGLIEVDGVRVQFRDKSFFLIRASNTSPMLTFRFEGRTEETLHARYADAYALLEPFKNCIGGLEELAVAAKP